MKHIINWNAIATVTAALGLIWVIKQDIDQSTHQEKWEKYLDKQITEIKSDLNPLEVKVIDTITVRK